MSAETAPSVPIEEPARVGDLLSALERAKIEAVEEYRHDVSQRIAQRDGSQKTRAQFWVEKLLTPAFVAVLTVILSGYVFPKLLASHERRRHTNEVVLQIADDIATQTGTMQGALETYSDAVDSYWIGAARLNAVVGDLALRRDIGDISVQQFSEQDALLENDRVRLNDQRDTATKEYSREARAFRLWLNRIKVRLKVLYPQATRSPFDDAFTKLGNSADASDQAFEKRQAAYMASFGADIGRLRAVRAEFRANKISRETYTAEANKIIQSLRTQHRVPISGSSLDGNAVATAIAYLQRVPPVID